MAGAWQSELEETLLVFFTVKVRGVKLNACQASEYAFWTPVSFRRDPSSPYDPLCVEVLVRGGRKLGHVARKAAVWLEALLRGPFRISG